MCPHASLMFSAARTMRLQDLDGFRLFSNSARVVCAISLALCRSKSISDRVNIRGAGEVPSFRLSKAVEGVTEGLTPPLVEVSSVLLSELIQLLLSWVQLGRIAYSGQGDRTRTSPFCSGPIPVFRPNLRAPLEKGTVTLAAPFATAAGGSHCPRSHSHGRIRSRGFPTPTPGGQECPPSPHPTRQARPHFPHTRSREGQSRSLSTPIRRSYWPPCRVKDVLTPYTDAETERSGMEGRAPVGRRWPGRIATALRGKEEIDLRERHEGPEDHRARQDVESALSETAGR